MTIKELFESAEGGTLDYETFEKLVSEKGAKFVDVSGGAYVSKNKYEAELAGRDSQINDLNDTIKSRDKDLKNLNAQLQEAGTDSEKLTELQAQFGNLQSQYKKDTDAYKARLESQAYEFAVKEFAGTKKFSSKAAKRDFISSMIGKGLKMDKGTILGAEDFVNSYSVENSDAFVVENPEPEENDPPIPTFVQPTGGGNVPPDEDETGDFNFNFLGVRPREE